MLCGASGARFGPHPDIISVNAVLAACVSKWPEALHIYATLPSMELRPWLASKSLAGLTKSQSHHDRAWGSGCPNLPVSAQCFAHLPRSIVTLNSVMNACASGLQWQFAFELWRGFVACRFRPHVMWIAVACCCFACRW